MTRRGGKREYILFKLPPPIWSNTEVIIGQYLMRHNLFQDEYYKNIRLTKALVCKVSIIWDLALYFEKILWNYEFPSLPTKVIPSINLLTFPSNYFPTKSLRENYQNIKCQFQFYRFPKLGEIIIL